MKGDYCGQEALRLSLDVRPECERILNRTQFEASKRRVCFMVSSTDLGEGTGELYVALGLGFRLEGLGFSVLICKDNIPVDADIVVCLLPTFIRSFPEHAVIIGWIRNAVDEWLSSPSFLRLDGILCSSIPSLERIRKIASIPTGILRLAAEHELFKPGPGLSGVSLDAVSTINYWGNERELCRYCDPGDIGLQFFGVLEANNLDLPIAKYYRDPINYFDLPKLYNSARVCVDAFNDVTKPYGQINSRVYEALACGLPVVTSKPIKEDSILKDVVKFYYDADSLKLAIQSFIEGNWNELSRRGRAEILEKHTWVIRAQEFVSFLGSLKPKTRKGGIGFYPAFLDNPYQHLLYRELLEFNPLPIHSLNEIPHCEYLHIHWTSPITQIAETEAQAKLHVESANRILEDFISQGKKLIWTVHNITPHELRFAEAEAMFVEWLKANADLIHIMGASTLEYLSLSEPFIMPIGNYCEYYENEVSKDEARRWLGIESQLPVMLVLGQLRPYKGLEKLLKLEGCQIVVAGEPKYIDKHLIDQLRGRDVIVHDRRIYDWQIQYYMNASDYFLMLGSTFLNSASAMLALSFGVPVIGSNRGNLREIINESNGVLFDTEEQLLEIIKNPPKFSRDKILQETKLKYEWRKLIEPFKQILSNQLSRESRFVVRT